MSVKDLLFQNHITLDEASAEALSRSRPGYTVEVRPPIRGDVPATLNRFVKGIREYETKWLGLKNQSPVATFEIRRPAPRRLVLQFSLPNQRLERKVRTQLADEIPGVGFEQGDSGLPVAPGDSIGGGTLSTGKADWYPLRTDFDSPPINSLVSTLHHHALPQIRVVVQIVFQPAPKGTIKNRLWSRKASGEARYLRKEGRETGSSPTQRERQMAQDIDEKVGSSRFNTAVRVLIIGGGEATLSYVKEITGGFNIFENSRTGTYLKTSYLRSRKESSFVKFAKAVRDAEFNGWGTPFQATDEELAALVTLPSRDQENIRTAEPR